MMMMMLSKESFKLSYCIRCLIGRGRSAHQEWRSLLAPLCSSSTPCVPSHRMAKRSLITAGCPASPDYGGWRCHWKCSLNTSVSSSPAFPIAGASIRDSASLMACSALATVSASALAPAATSSWHRNMLLCRQGLVLAAPSSRLPRKLVVNRSRVVMSAAPRNENKVAGLTGIALLVAAAIPEMAEAAQPGVSDSLKNLLLSVVAGGTVLTAITGAVAGVSTFDPVKRK